VLRGRQASRSAFPLGFKASDTPIPPMGDLSGPAVLGNCVPEERVRGRLGGTELPALPLAFESVNLSRRLVVAF